MGNADPNNTKAGKEYEVKPQTSVIKACYQLAVISIEPLYPHSVSTGEIIGLSSSCPSAITARFFSDTTDQSVTTPMIVLYLSGMIHLSAGHNVALSQVLNRSKAQYVCMNAMKFKSDFNMHITHLTQARQLQLLKLATSLVTFNTAGTSLELKSKSSRELKNSRVYLHENVRSTLLLRVPLQRRLRPPNWYQSNELLKPSSAPPISLQTTAEIDGNLPEKGLNEQ
ncbi:hypothetical protein F511_13499 [Dorcoceras hygrometricum]|uniref:Uncharacterized protein n=1 Tax=Dorcoceras hygrometricum TaxID=472368 RepID=A0A2Z7CGH6_9LAMI|nr:hypothetical protein F511_13499 [Dorcoceras hygrometricum]